MACSTPKNKIIGTPTDKTPTLAAKYLEQIK
jgi:hypothetical protein